MAVLFANFMSRREERFSRLERFIQRSTGVSNGALGSAYVLTHHLKASPIGKENQKRADRRANYCAYYAVSFKNPPLCTGTLHSSSCGHGAAVVDFYHYN